MPQNENEKTYANQNVILENRNIINLTGVCDVVSFDDETLLLETPLGKITVKGEGLTIKSFNTDTGDFTAHGKINAVVYMSEVKSGGFFSKLLK